MGTNKHRNFYRVRIRSTDFVRSADIYVSGRTIRYRIPLQALGLQRGKCIEFKVTDNITSPDKITDYYVSGDSAPIGRINYSYKLA